MSTDGLSNTLALDSLKELLGDDLPELLADFKRQLITSLTEIELALSNNNYKRVRFQAHRLKGSALDLQCATLADICHQLEKAAIATDAALLKEGYLALRRHCACFTELE